MKKILIFSILFISTYCYSVDLDNAYRNARLNVDFSSSIIFNDKEIVKEDELAQWILSNPDNFANINQIKIDFGAKWYWGSWKRVVKALEFVKKENVQNRLAYFENLRKINEKNRSWSWQEIAQGLLESYNNNSDFKAIVDYSAKKVKEGVESFKENWKNASSEGFSNDSYSNNSSAKDEKAKSKDDCESNYNNVSITNKSNWSKDNSLAFNDYRQKIEFSDGTSGYIYQGSETKKYFLSLNPSSIYYDSYESVIRALYIYKKCDKITKLGKN